MEFTPYDSSSICGDIQKIGVDHSPFISIVLPVYNSARTLDRCLQCVARQTYTNWGVIVVDSDSSDRTFSIVKKWSDKLGNRCRYYNIKKRNIAFARNFGARVSDGDRILTLESDVYLTSRVLEECVNKAKNGYQGVGIPTYMTWLNKGYIPACRYYLTCMEGDPDPLPNFVPRQLWSKLGGQDERFVPHEDLDFGLKFKRKGYKMTIIKEYALHDSNASLKHFVRRSRSSTVAEKRLKKWQLVVERPHVRRILALDRLRYLLLKKPIFLPGALLVVLIAVISRASAKLFPPSWTGG